MTQNLTTAQKTISKVLSHNIIGVEDEAANNHHWIKWFGTQFHRQDQSKPVYCYSMSEGIRKFHLTTNKGQTQLAYQETKIFEQPEIGVDPVSHYLNCFLNFRDNGIFIFQDLHKSIIDPRTGNYDPLVVSYLRVIATTTEANSGFTKRLIFLGQKINLPDELIRLIPVLKFPLPNLKTREKALSRAIGSTQSREPIEINKVAESASGLTLNEISIQVQNCHHNASFCGGSFNTTTLIGHLNNYKTELLRRLKVEVYPNSNDQFGGHEILKSWLDQAFVMMQPEIQTEYGLPKYKGMLLAGVSGCGKTLVAKSIASQWNMPLIKLNLGALKGRYVGESEGNLKQALELTKYIDGILLIDEVEKGTAGHSTDNTGVSGGMLSILLDHLNEQNNQFVVLTANNVTQIPSELLRSGRINERWFVDLPGKKSREEIIKIHLYTDPRRVDPDYREELEPKILQLVDRTKGYSGAEIEEIILRGLREAICQQRPQRPEFKDFLKELPVPLKTFNSKQHQKIEEYKQLAKLTSNDRD